MKKVCFMLVLMLAFTASSIASAEVTLRASHQWPGGQGDIRDEMIRVMARSVENADVDLKIQIYPAESLFEAKEQWGALTRGRLDIAAFPLDYASGRHPAFSATLMPGLVRSHERAERLDDSEFMDMIKDIIYKAGVRVLADAWLSGGFVSQERCITDPDSVQGQKFRAAGPAFEQMLAAAGASIASMPSSDIYTALQTGVLDGANTSSGSLLSYRLYEQVSCVTAPGENALWFMYEPVLISKRSWDQLNKEQQAALQEAASEAEDYFRQEASNLDQKMADVFAENGVEVVTMSKEDYDAWVQVAQESAYKKFIADVPQGEELIDAALAVD